MIGAIGDVISIVDVTAEYFKFAKPDAGQILLRADMTKPCIRRKFRLPFGFTNCSAAI